MKRRNQARRRSEKRGGRERERMKEREREEEEEERREERERERERGERERREIPLDLQRKYRQYYFGVKWKASATYPTSHIYSHQKNNK